MNIRQPQIGIYHDDAPTRLRQQKRQVGGEIRLSDSSLATGNSDSSGGGIWSDKSGVSEMIFQMRLFRERTQALSLVCHGRFPPEAADIGGGHGGALYSTSLLLAAEYSIFTGFFAIDRKSCKACALLQELCQK
jgi:hypothetical protein